MKRIWFLLLWCWPPILHAQDLNRGKLDSLLSMFRSEKYRAYADSDKVKFLHQISSSYGHDLHSDSASLYAREGLTLAKSSGYLYGQALCLAALGDANYNSFDIALDYHLRALKIFEQLNDVYNTAWVTSRIAGLYFNMEQFPRALDYFTKALSGYQQANSTVNIAAAHNSIAATYINLNDFPKALDNELLALKYFQDLGDSMATAKACSNIANCYAGLHEYNKALQFSSRAVRELAVIARGQYNRLYARCLSERGYIHYLVATDSNFAIHPDSLVPAGKSANLAKAIEYNTAAYNLFLKAPHFAEYDILRRLSDAWAASGRPDSAFKYLQQAVAVKDSVLSMDTRLRIATLETTREADLTRKQMEINRIQHRNALRERWLFAISLALFGLFGASTWRSYRRQRTANVSLELAKRKSDDLAADLQESIVHKDQLAAQLSYAADMKTKFLANISHELRTPVTVLKGMLELIKTGFAGDRHQEKERVEIAYNNSRKLQYMVEEILDLSRLDTAQVKMIKRVVELSPMLRRMVYAFETFIEKEGLSLEYSDDRTKVRYADVDERMLEKIVNNLVYNAVKFNAPGGWIRVNTRISADGQRFVFTISNSGPGIGERDLPYIFDRYYQGSSSSPKAEGAGIGLALVKEFTSMMDGSVSVDSSAQNGTTFALEFPLVQRPDVVVHLADALELAPLDWGHFNERQSVLLVEDNAEMRYYLRAVLGDTVNIIEAVDGKDALKQLEERHVDLVISDLMMPEMDGAELVSRLKNAPKFKKLPVITLTALANHETRLSMLRLGIDDYLIKPFNADELRVRVYNLLNNLEERREFEQRPAEPDDIPVSGVEAEEFRSKVAAFVLSRMKTINVSVYDLAYQLNMSERQLYRHAKSQTGCTPAQLIKEVRLQRAYELLLSGTINKLDDVARQVGFEDPSYFAKQFYQRFGKRPTDFF